ncbi:MAG: archease [Pseudothermotoga sp.]
MYRELDHVADLRYELVCEDLESVFCDLILILKSNYKPVLKRKVVLEKQYQIKEIEDMVFDVVNDWIYMIDAQKVFPLQCRMGNLLYCSFVGFSKLRGLELKALTYHELKAQTNEGKIMLKVVFDT